MIYKVIHNQNLDIPCPVPIPPPVPILFYRFSQVLSYKLHFYLAGYFDNHLKFKLLSYHFCVVEFVLWLFSSIIPKHHWFTWIPLTQPASCYFSSVSFFLLFHSIFFPLPLLQNQGCSKHLKLLHFLIQLF